jgi:hypothetical protein
LRGRAEDEGRLDGGKSEGGLFGEGWQKSAEGFERMRSSRGWRGRDRDLLRTKKRRRLTFSALTKSQAACSARVLLAQ